VKSSTRLVLVDLDNTLYDWVAFFVPSLLAMVDTVREATEADRDQLLREFKTVYSRHGSVEYSFCVQALPSVAALSLYRRKALVRRCRAAFLASRQSHLIAYPGVPETLRALSDAGIILVATTNAPMHQAMRRLETLGGRAPQLFGASRSVCTADHRGSQASGLWSCGSILALRRGRLEAVGSDV
jgi:phosphoglycolate phosphatase-like HAD superfamily hydrolase